MHVSAETLADTDTETDTETDAKNVPAETLHPETIRRLACDGGLVTIIENAKGSPLSVGRKTRRYRPLHPFVPVHPHRYRYKRNKNLRVRDSQDG